MAEDLAVSQLNHGITQVLTKLMIIFLLFIHLMCRENSSAQIVVKSYIVSKVVNLFNLVLIFIFMKIAMKINSVL